VLDFSADESDCDDPNPWRPHDPVAAVSAIVVGVLAIPLFWAVHFSLTDDGYITLDYARTLAYHGTWGMVPHYAANAATSPLNVLILAAGIFVTHRPLLALGIEFVVCNAALAWCVARVARVLEISVLISLLGVALILLNPFVLASLGLESTLLIALLGFLLLYAVERRPNAFGVASGFALVARPDMILFIIPLVLSTHALRRGWLTIARNSVLVAAIWFVPRWFAGSAVSDTFVWKTLQQKFCASCPHFGDGPWQFIQGTRSKAWFSFAPVVIAAAAGIAWGIVYIVRRSRPDPRLLPVVALGIGGAIYYGAYAALNVPPYHWYYVPTLASTSIVIGIVAAFVLHLAKLHSRGVPIATSACAMVVVVLAGQAVTVVHHGLPSRREPIIFDNWAEPAQYAAVGRALRSRVGDKTVASPGEIGTLAFYCHCKIIDLFSDERFAVPLINERIRKAGPIMKWLLQLNYRNLNRRTGPYPLDYYLTWDPGWVSTTGDPNVWNVWAPHRGFGHFTLHPR